MGVFYYQYCCGNYNSLLDSLPSICIDVMDGIDPTSGIGVGHTKEHIGTQLTLMGGFSRLILIEGTPGPVCTIRRCSASLRVWKVDVTYSGVPVHCSDTRSSCRGPVASSCKYDRGFI